MSAPLNELERDTALLDRAEQRDEAGARTWVVSETYVVVGLGQTIPQEVDEAACAALHVPIVRRSSGGGAVMIAPGTVQWAMALPYSLSPNLQDISVAKAVCNRLVIRALGHELEDQDGDLMREGKKVGGLALRRRRRAVLVHGTLLANADLVLLSRCLKHPSKEPAHRRGRPHSDFLHNLGPIDHEHLEQVLQRHVADLARCGIPP